MVRQHSLQNGMAGCGNYDNSSISMNSVLLNEWLSQYPPG
jgi:hypothetical protein